MRLIGSGKAADNERKYSHIVALAVTGRGLNIELSRQIMNFHKAHRIQPRHGRSALPKTGGETHFRWCFADLATAQAFAEQFGGLLLHEG